MNRDYWLGFAAGQEHERKKAAALLSFYLESLKEVKGIGDTLYQRIVEHINSVEVKGNEQTFTRD
jgi:L-amino acid N-acyltransferase YncA